MQAENNENLVMLKAVLVGDATVGKSSFMLKMIESKFHETYVSTIGVDFMTFTLPEQNVKIQLWDTAGQERFRTITTAYYKAAHFFLICFDVNERQTFDNLGKWLDEIKAHTDHDFEVLFIGNKNDLDNRKVSVNEAENFALSHGGFYMDTSSKLEDSLVMRKKVDEIVEKMKLKGFEHYGIKPPAN